MEVRAPAEQFSHLRPGERGVRPPDLENPAAGAERWRTGWGSVFSLPHMVCEGERPFMSPVNMSPAAGVGVYHGEEMTFFTPNLI